MSSTQTALLQPSEQTEVYGNREPRISTKPLRPLIDGPAGVRTTDGYRVIKFAREVLKMPLMPWQQEAVIRALELLPSGKYRFKTVLIIVARQNGKSFLSQVVSLFKMFILGLEVILGTAQDLSIAKLVWEGAVKIVEATPELAVEIVRVRTANGECTLELTNGSQYKIKASTGSAGRGLTVDHLTLDEIREHRTDEAYAALKPTTRVPPMSQIWAISNAGDAQSVVLNDLRAKAVKALAMPDATIGLFEWSAEERCALDDIEGWKAANPSLGHMFPIADMYEALSSVSPDRFRTEYLCQSVENLDGAVDAAAWKGLADSNGTMDDLRERVALFLDVAPDSNHVTLVAAAETDSGPVRVEVVESWETDAKQNATEKLRKELPAWVEKIKPKAFAYFAGPASALAPELGRLGATSLNNAKASEACQSFADLVQARGLVHSDDPLLNAHVIGAKRYPSGDGWRFTRKQGHVDAAYAAAGAVYLTRTTEEPEPAPNWLIY